MKKFSLAWRFSIRKGVSWTNRIVCNILCLARKVAWNSLWSLNIWIEYYQNHQFRRLKIKTKILKQKLTETFDAVRTALNVESKVEISINCYFIIFFFIILPKKTLTFHIFKIYNLWLILFYDFNSLRMC